jgi:hypothetical protein
MESIHLFQVSEEQLQMLEMRHKDKSSEIISASIGVACGAAPSTISWLIEYFSGPVVIETPELVQVLLFFSAIVVGLIVWRLNAGQEKMRRGVIDRIRQQRKPD